MARIGYLNIYLLLFLLSPLHASAQVPPTADEAAAKARERQVQGDLSGSATVPSGGIVVEGTVDGGRVRASIAGELPRIKANIQLETPLQEGSPDSNFLTLEQLPGDASMQTRFSFELLSGSPESLQVACSALNQGLHDRFAGRRVVSATITRPPLGKDPTTAELQTYVQSLEDGLRAAGGEWRGRTNAAESQLLITQCQDWNKQHPEAPLLPTLFGIRQMRQSQNAKELLCAKPDESSMEISDRYISSPICSTEALKRRAAEIGALQSLQEAVGKQLSSADSKPMSEKLRSIVDDSQCRAVQGASQAFRTYLAQELARLRPDFAQSERDVLVSRMEFEFLNSRESGGIGNAALADAFVYALVFTNQKPAMPTPAAGTTPGSPSPCPAAMPDCATRAGTIAQQAETLWVTKLSDEFKTSLTAALRPHLAGMSGRQLDDQVTKAEQEATKSIEEQQKGILTKLKDALTPIADDFNTYPVTDMILVGSAACTFDRLQAALGTKEPGRERNAFFRSLSRALPAATFLTINAETAAQDFAWLQTFPPTLDDKNQIARSKDRKYNTGYGLSLTQFVKGLTLEATFMQREVFEAAPQVEVCVDLPGGGSLICRTASLKEPKETEEQLLSVGAKYFFTPAFAARFWAGYELKNNVLNPHAFLFFIPEKGILRGGLDLAYLRNHPEFENGFQARLFFGVPLKPDF